MIWHGTMRPITVALYFMATGAAIVSFLHSQEAQRLGDIDGFVFWHGLWHVYPLVAAIVILVDFYSFGGDHDSVQDDKAKDKYPVPLSTYLMRKLSFTTPESYERSKLKTF
jgi:hypothetical protein